MIETYGLANEAQLVSGQLSVVKNRLNEQEKNDYRSIFRFLFIDYILSIFQLLQHGQNHTDAISATISHVP